MRTREEILAEVQEQIFSMADLQERFNDAVIDAALAKANDAPLAEIKCKLDNARLLADRLSACAGAASDVIRSHLNRHAVMAA